MRKLGISLYPEKTSMEKMISYIELSASYNFNRIFLSFLQLGKNKKQTLSEYEKIIHYAKELEFEVIIDVAPRLFDELKMSYTDLSLIKKLGADGIRLDAGYSGNEEAMMTYNPEDLLIELNMSNDVAMIDTVMDYMPNRYNLLGCHNFYPHQYSGLSLEHFIACSHRFRKYGIRTAAFIHSQVEDSTGPWPVTQGLPTLEEHRNLPIDVQLKHFISLDVIDDLIISNMFASKEELSSLSLINKPYLVLDVELISDLPSVERSIVLDEFHFNRGDVSDYLLRSTQSRVKYKEHHFNLFNPKPFIERGDIIIESSEYGHYAGELQIALQDMKNSGKSNVVGKVVDVEHFLLDSIKPWQKFKMQEVQA